MGFAEADRETLLTLRGNLLRGLDRVAAHAAAGTLYEVPPGAATPPAASGWLMTILLEQVNAELREREVSAAVVPVP